MSIDILLSFSADAILSMRSVSRKCEIFFSFIFLSKLVVNRVAHFLVFEFPAGKQEK